jgi:hypothetical protein
MQNMRREFGGRSSNESKAQAKRSGGGADEKISAMSPYQSHEDLSSMLDQHDDGTVQTVEDLDSRVAATRQAAHKAIMVHFSRNIVDAALEGNAATIALRGCHWLTSSKSNTENKVDGVDLSFATVLCCGDTETSLYDEVATTLVTWITSASTAKQPDAAVVAKVMETLSFLSAANPQCTVGDGSLHDAIHGTTWWTAFEKSSDPRVLGAIASGLAATCSVTSRNTTKQFVQKVIKKNAVVAEGSSSGSANATSTLITCVEALGILHDRFKGTITTEEAECLVDDLQGWDKEVSNAVRKLASVLEASAAPTPGGDAVSPTSSGAPSASLDATGVSPVGSGGGLELPTSPSARLPTLKNRAAPFEQIQFRERSVTIEGHYLIYLLDALRNVVGEGLLNHIAHNPTVRRVFGVKVDLVTKMTKEEAAMEKDAMNSRKVEKELQFRERSKDRQRKRTAQGGGEVDDDGDD